MGAFMGMGKGRLESKICWNPPSSPSFRDFSHFRRKIVVNWLVRWAVGLVSSRGQNRVAETFIVPLSSLYIRVSGLSWAVNKRGRRS